MLMLPLFKGLRPLNPLALGIEVILLFGATIFIYSKWFSSNPLSDTYIIICTGLLFFSIVSTVMLILSEHTLRTWYLAVGSFIVVALVLNYLGVIVAGKQLSELKPYLRLVKVLTISFVIFMTIGAGIRQVADFTKRMK